MVGQNESWEIGKKSERLNVWLDVYMSWMRQRKDFRLMPRQRVVLPIKIRNKEKGSGLEEKSLVSIFVSL